MALMPMPSLACSCTSFTPIQLAQEADAIFTGIPRAYLGAEWRTVVEFDVHSVYKGVLTQRIRVAAVGARGPSGGLGPGCEYGFELGRLYTVFTRDYDSDGVLDTDGCFQNVEGPIAPGLYGLMPGHAPQGADELTLVLVAATAVAAMAFIARTRQA